MPLYVQIGHRMLPVGSLEEASLTVRTYLDARGLGASEFRGGEVWRHGEVVARVSYNGRVWGPDGWTPGTAPLFDPYA